MGSPGYKKLPTRAFLKRAPLLLLDEPTANLDALTERSILHAIHSLIVAKATGVSMSTIYELERGHRLSKLSRGKILDGSSKHLGREVNADEIDEFSNHK
jgi:ABC-type transport system involved in cytochrome bd biosynthesis fused ATPase/permease subunit